jgi:hypothetical protein
MALSTEPGYDTKLVVPGNPWFIYGIPTNINYFLTEPLVPVAARGVEYQTGTRKEHKRRKYVGDPTPSTIPEHPYAYMDDPGRKVGNALPGWSFILDDGTEKRQFTTTADVVTLVAFLETAVKGYTRLYTQGARYKLKDPALSSEIQG